MNKEKLKQIKKVRQAKGWTQIKAAKTLDVSLSTYRMWEYGVNEPNEENKKRLKTVFGIDLDKKE